MFVQNACQLDIIMLQLVESAIIHATNVLQVILIINVRNVIKLIHIVQEKIHVPVNLAITM